MAEETAKEKPKKKAQAYSHIGVRPHPQKGYEVWEVTMEGGKASEKRLSPAPEPLVHARARARVEFGRRMP